MSKPDLFLEELKTKLDLQSSPSKDRYDDYFKQHSAPASSDVHAFSSPSSQPQPTVDWAAVGVISTTSILVVVAITLLARRALSRKRPLSLGLRKWLVISSAWAVFWLFVATFLDRPLSEFGLGFGYGSSYTTSTLAVAFVAPILGGLTWRAWHWALR